MAIEYLDQGDMVHQRMIEGEKIQQMVDKDGNRWKKVYFGSGAHFRNWLSQAIELKGKQNVKIEEADSRGFQCYEKSGGKMYRIWVRENGEHGEEQ